MTYLVVASSPESQQKAVGGILVTILPSVDPVELLATSSPDLFQLGVVEGTTIGVDDIKKLQGDLKFKPLLLPKQLVIIWRAEQLTPPAQNALLKDLEEHSNDTVYILVVTQTNALLPTIRSRCQIVYGQAAGETVRKDQQETKAASDLATALTGADNYSLATLFALILKLVETKDTLALYAFLQQLSQAYHRRLKQSVEKQDSNAIQADAHNLEAVQQAYFHLQRNGNKRLVLENLILQLR